MSTLNEFNTTPVAKSRWVYINSPGAWVSGKYTTKGITHKTEGARFKLTHVYDLDNPEHAAFVEHFRELEKLTEEMAKSDKSNKGKNLTLVSRIKELHGEESGKVEICFYTKAAAQDGSAKTVALYDSSNPPKPIKDRPNIGNGTTTSIIFNPGIVVVQGKIYMTPYLIGVQLVNLVEYKPSAGFSSQNGGFKEKATEENSDNLASLIEKSSDNPAY